MEEIINGTDLLKLETEISSENFLNYNEDYLITGNELKNSNIVCSEVLAKLGEFEDEINENVIFQKALLFKELIKKQKNHEIRKIFIYNDNDDISYAFSEIFENVLSSEEKNNVFKFEKNTFYSKDMALNEIIKNEYDYSIFFLKENKEFYRIIFRKNNFQYLTKQEEDFINKKITLTKFNSELLKNKNKKTIYINKNINIVLNEKIKRKYLMLVEGYREFDQIKNISENFTLNFIKKPSNYFKYYKRIIKKEFIKDKKSKHDVFFYSENSKNIEKTFIKNKNKYQEISNEDINFLLLNYFIKTDTDFHNTSFYIPFKSSNNVKEFLYKNNHQNIKTYNNLNDLYYFLSREIKIKNERAYIFDGNQIIKLNFSNNFIGFESISNLLLKVEMFEFYEKNKIDIFKTLEENKKNYLVSAAFKDNRTMNYNSFLNFYKKIRKERKIAKFKIEKLNINKLNEVRNLNKRKIFIEINLKDGTEILMEFDKILNEVKTEIVSSYFKSNIYDIVKKEESIRKEMEEYSHILKENNPNNKWKNILKFSSFLLFIFLVFLILFSTIYRTKDSELEGPLAIFKNFYDIFLSDYKLRFIFLAIVVSNVGFYFFYSMMLYRVFRKQKMKINFKHLFLAAMISTIVQNITPFSFGGDLSSYWYLQKKGYSKPNLASAFAFTSLFHQVSVLFISLIFIPMGFYFYQDILLKDIDARKIITFIFILLGIILNIVLFLLILFVSILKKMQLFIIKIIIFIYKNNPFSYNDNLDRKKIILENKFLEFKINFKNLFKDFLFFLECLFLYKILPFLLNTSIIVLILIEKDIILVNNNFSSFLFWYLNFQSGSSLLNMANNLSPTPGGIGTSDWLMTVIFQNVFVTSDKELIENNLKIFSFSTKIFYWLIPNIISALMLLTLYLGEKRIDKYKQIATMISIDPKISKNFKKTKTIFFRNALLMWIIGIISIVFIILIH
ncbi:lysylphosphatidylglycerol synthase transmembrane domain-containing protein [Mesomycoplasma molare]|uniref:Lysylphosphatidylglycerol synthase domain-containing protein n=1 Tax=Mesomycoplasma molare TaxID=171288 RepID=A0ABY5TV18_9BACT|nr:YbhN family protein [Mesomycoplasma molare]UWD34090.1 lysylphosphatidylglycerol synthase domain-containing protein [Mesomycoplasma molare]